MQLDNNTYRLRESGSFGRRALIIGIIGLALSAVGYFLDAERFFHSYLTSFVFWVTIGVGGLFFVMLHHLTSAKWSVVLRRLTENFMITVPVLAVLFLPLILGIQDLFHWSHADAVAHDELLQQKAPYLNTPFFLIRAAIYFGIWILFGRMLYKVSIAQDSQKDDSLIARMKKLSAPGMLLFALTLTFASFDWLMSLDAHWYSTIFGVYVFSGSLLAILAILTLIAIYFRENDILRETITIEHYHDLGKLMFAFTVFWAYIAFSQFMLIWYGNIPEETIWYKHRWEDLSWRIVSLIVLFGHFVVPFLALVTRAAKRNLTMLKVTSIWLLLMHWVDLYWIVLPNYGHSVHFSWMDITTMIGIGGIVLWYFWKATAAHALIPVNDPKLQASIEFENQ
ncbi:MAG: hypothetical protein K9N46_00005 [Candidatus Marinimicrobia bacterium]|nr:hypothetical protein [Candidatus Neomarinimicrobiota bacterium]MCF7829935.1 hypothetical protein [Candidatus Neomarinimicrobiota bacterium]MCF7879102.1 hypothetical protein [Candidatus Neomarinimicrobiota bacterium]